jgi:hypothetical protein
LKLFPGSAQDEQIKVILNEPPLYPSYGVKEIILFPAFSQNSFSYLSKEEFSGINSVSLTLFDNQIIAFRIRYTAYPGTDSPWDNVAQLIPIFSETFNLPQVSAWINYGDRAELKCNGFEFVLFTGNGPSAYLTSKYDFKEIIRQRKEADKQKGRAAFKP